MLEHAPPGERKVDPSAATASPASTLSLYGDDDAMPSAELRPGTILKGCYRIERRLGAGGMGTVYLAQHLEIEKRVAIKLLGPDSMHRPQLKERFLREARATASIDDEHVIAIHDFGAAPDGAAFFVMEYLQGIDLAAFLKHHAPLPWPRARDIALQICTALAAAHAKGVIHRDMKPANIFRLDRSGPDFIKVLDFGIAKVVRPEKRPSEGLTHTGMLFGTPEYMSPEQAQGERHDHRVDIYAVGVILFEMLTGHLPFRAETFMALLSKHASEAPPRPSDLAPRAGIPAAAEAVVLKALQKDPALRFQTMTEMADALTAASAGIAPLVVPEQLKTPHPRGKPTTFRTTREDVAAPRRAWPLLAAAAVAGAAITAVLLANGLRSEVLDPPAPIALATPDDAPPGTPLAVTMPIAAAPPPAPTVVVHLDTGGIAARIFDERDQPLGDTTTDLVLPRAHAERHLSLRASGYHDLDVTVVPADSQTLTALLIRAGKPTRGAHKPAHQDPVSPPPPPPTPTPTPPVDDKPRTKGTGELMTPNFDTR